jgi:hypothetical protein
LCAGPYVIKSRYGNIDYRLMCRKSFEKYLTEEYVNEWWSI